MKITLETIMDVTDYFYSEIESTTYMTVGYFLRKIGHTPAPGDDYEKIIKDYFKKDPEDGRNFPAEHSHYFIYEEDPEEGYVWRLPTPEEVKSKEEEKAKKLEPDYYTNLVKEAIASYSPSTLEEKSLVADMIWIESIKSHVNTEDNLKYAEASRLVQQGVRKSLEEETTDKDYSEVPRHLITFTHYTETYRYTEGVMVKDDYDPLFIDYVWTTEQAEKNLRLLFSLQRLNESQVSDSNRFLEGIFKEGLTIPINYIFDNSPSFKIEVQVWGG